ncbi:MAG TPA: cob(I)yrinic acid a,c-diamide adenosyltransferase [Moraxellaceae bacterium]|nr:cob(I)yrinic acid a,c-diamide adenosyltransferase [Moraxellaceae bacterium]
MGNRLSRIYTRTGDDGSTGLGDGSRVAKDHVRVEAYGTVDELNAAIGLLRAELPTDHSEQHFLGEIQHDLFDLGGELCIPGYVLLRDEQVNTVESEIDRLNAALPPLKDFILPGGSRAAATAHLARTICRRAERRTFTLAHSDESVREVPVRYLNRLSDYLFVLARVLARENGASEVLWSRTR